MKIEHVTTEKAKLPTFGALKYGEVFTSPEGSAPYIKIETIITVGQSKVNAINLKSGTRIVMSGNAVVTPLPHAKLVI